MERIFIAFYIFRRGNFRVKRSDGRFNEVPSDQCIEQTINRQQKCHGGIIGFSTSEGTVQRWVLTSHVVSKLISQIEEELKLKRPLSKPKDLGQSRRNFDNNCSSSSTEIINNWGNPFQQRDVLINICSGVEARQDVADDLLNAETLGKQSFDKFWKDRIESSTTSFYEPIKQLKLKTFYDMLVKKTVKLNDKTVTIAAERSMFGRLLIVAKSRDTLTLKQILNYSLSPIPWCFGLPDGGLVKTNKSKLLGKNGLKV